MAIVYKVALVGITGAGKTTYVYRLRNLPLHRVVRTRNVELHRIRLDSEYQSGTTVLIYDFPGHDEYKALVRSNFEVLKIPSLLIFIDLTRFDESVKYVEDVVGYVTKFVNEAASVVIGNKADIAPPGLYEKLVAVCERLGDMCHAVFEISAINDDLPKLLEPIKALIAISRPMLLI